VTDNSGCSACGGEKEQKDAVDVENIVDKVIEDDLGETLESLIRETVQETLKDFGVFPNSGSDKPPVEVTLEGKPDRIHKILEVVDDVVKEHLKCASPSFREIRRQAMDLFWVVANRLEKEGIPVTPKDQGVILRRIWDHLKKAKVCPLNI
jgi:hypothetical protein